MNVWIRLFRRPVATVAWLLILVAMASFLGVGGSLLYSTYAMEASLDSQYTTIAIRGGTTTDEDGNQVFPGALLAEELEALKALPSVEMVDMRTLTGAYIPELTARLGLRDWANVKTKEKFHQMDVDINNQTTNVSYNEMVLVGTVEEVRSAIRDPHNYYDLSAVGLGSDLQSTCAFVTMNVEQVLSAHPTYHIFETEEYSEYCGKVFLEVYLWASEETPFFETGKRYIVSGSYDPSCHGREKNGLSTPHEMFLPWVNLNVRNRASASSIILQEEDRLVAYRQGESEAELSVPDEAGNMINRETFTQISDPMVIAQEVTGNLETLLEKNPDWQQWIQETEQMQHAFPVLGTENLETMQCFLTNAATVTQGRTFTQEEYDTGAKVLMLSEELAQAGNIQVGDTLTLNQFLCDTGEWTNPSLSWCGTPLEMLNEPDVGYRPLANGMEEEEAFTVVGIYRMERSWEDTAYSITPNTIFMPQKAQLAGGYGGCDVMEYVTTMITRIYNDGTTEEVLENIPNTKYRGTYGVFLSVKVKNGHMADFQEEVTAAGLEHLNFVTLDQDYASAVASVHQAQSQSLKLFGIIALCWVVLLMLYLMLFQGKQQKNLGIMRSLGATTSQTRGYLFGGGILPALVGVGLGAALSGTVSKLLYSQLSQFLFQADTSVSHSGGQAMTGELADGILTLSTLPLGKLLLLVLAQLLVIAVLLWFQSWILSRKKPRLLIGKA